MSKRTILTVSLILFTFMLGAFCDTAFSAASKGIDFSGSNNTNDRVQGNVGSARYLDNLTAFTLAGWIKADQTNEDTNDLFGQNNVIQVVLKKDGKIELWTEHGGSVITSNVITTGTWYHVAAVGNGSTLRVYVNAVQKISGGKSPGGSGSYGGNDSRTRVGGNVSSNSSNRIFNGIIDNVSMWSRALSTDEIKRLMNTFYETNLDPNLSETGLILYWHFEGSGNTVQDGSGNGRTGSLVNSPSRVNGPILGAYIAGHTEPLVGWQYLRFQP